MRFSLDGYFTGIGELDRVANEINQNLRQAAAIAATGRVMLCPTPEHCASTWF
jgi:hypothetical protein